MTSGAEFAHKHARTAAWLEAQGAGAALFLAPANLAWLACGGELSRSDCRAAFVVAADRCVLLAPIDDAERIRQEEVRGLGIEIVVAGGSTPEALAAQARALLPEKTAWRCDIAGAGLDVDPSADMLRRTLTDTEIERLRRLGLDAATALEEVAAECFRGILERDAAGRLAAECVRRQITPRAILAGADERLESYTRPLPKGAAAEHVLMLALVGMRGGLHVTLARTICLSRPSSALTERFATMAEVAARARHECCAGDRLGDVVERALPQPLAHVDHYGGIIGYRWPEVEATRDSEWELAGGQALAWRLAAPGVRFEDTHLLGTDGVEQLTVSEDWPTRSYRFAGRDYEVPDLLLL
jgi:antitoxin VapB